MIFQTDERIGLEGFADTGCFVMAALNCVAIVRRKGFSPEEIGREVLKLQHTAIPGTTKPVIDSEFFVNNYDEIAHHFGIRAIVPAHKMPYTYTAKPDELLIGKFVYNKLVHAMCTNRVGIPTYDPLGDSLFRDHGGPADFRVLTWGY